MATLAKLGTYAAWTVVALTAAAARPASADLLEAFRSDPAGDPTVITGSFPDDGSTAQIPPQSDTFNEAWSFADADETAPLPPQGDEVVRPDEGSTTPPVGPTAIAEADLLVGTWAWEGHLEGMAAYIETAFYPDGTYEAVIDTPVIQLYETGTWAMVGNMVSLVVLDYAPRVIQTPYGPQPVPMEMQSSFEVAFLDADTVETEIGLSYRID